MEFNIADMFESVVGVCHDRVALVCGEQRLTYGELNEKANRLASFLQGRGVGTGSHVGLHLYNSAEFIIGMTAALKLRAVPINVNYRYVADELRYIFEDANLVALVTQSAFTPEVGDASTGNSMLNTFVHVTDETGDAHVDGSVEFWSALESADPNPTFEPRSGDDLYIIYTGGTTGMPKGVMWRHEDIFFAGLQGGRPGGEHVERPEEVAEFAASPLNALNIHPAAPLIHGAAQLASWICMNTGGRLVLVQGRSFVPEITAKAIGDDGINVINLVGDAMARPLAEVILADPARYDVSGLVALSSAGAILSDSVKEQLQAALPDTMVLNNFGASETGHQGTAIDMGDGKLRFFMHGDATMVVDDDMKPVAVGETGWIARKGHVPLGYYRDEEKTKKTFATIDGQRYVVPGDRGILEEETIILLGRGSICINTGGEKVFPEEVEEALKGHAAVMDAIVVGLPDEKWGQRVSALVLLRDGHSCSEEEIGAHCRSKVAGYKTPRSWFFVETLNRQPSGKPDYRWAKAKALELDGAS